MNFRTSYSLCLSAICLAVSAQFFVPQAQSEVLKVTGPNGETRQQVRQYGPTTVNDTFWSIAQKVRPDDRLSIYQVMAAIFEANPQAFTSNNYNSLERGMILLIPSRDVMAAIPVNLARNRAEQDDRAWNRQAAAQPTPAPQAQPQPEPEPQPVAQPAAEPAQAATPAPKTTTRSVAVEKQTPAASDRINDLIKQNAELKAQLEQVNDSLAQSEAARETLEIQNKSMDERLTQLESQLADTKLAFARLKEELALQQAAAETAPVASEDTAASGEPTEDAASEEPQSDVEMPDDTWRSLMDNPALLAAVTGGPAVLILAGLWAFLRRKRKNAESAQADENAAAPLSELDLDDDLAAGDESSIHLDDDDSESLDDLLDIDNLELHPEAEIESDDEQMAMAQEMFVDSGDGDDDAELMANEEGQSLDDLWAEAMGEQEQEELGSKPKEEDLDSLLDGIDDEPSLKESLPDDVAAAFEQDFGVDDDDGIDLSSDDDFDADALLAELEDDNNDGAAVDDIDADALLAELESDLPAEDDTAAELDADELLKELEQTPAAEPEQAADEDFDADALLAEFESADTAADPEELDLSDAIISEFDEAGADSNADAADELDADALLAELEGAADSSDDDVAAQDTADVEDLSAQIAAELDDEADVDSEQAATDELDPDALLAELEATAAPEDLSDAIAAELEDDELSAPELEDELDPDALLAELETPEDLSDEIAAELDADMTAEDEDSLDADQLLAELEAVAEQASAPETSDDDIELSLEDAVVEDELSLSEDAPSEYDELDADALLAELEKTDDDVTLSAESASDADEDFDFSLEDELSHPEQAENFDSLLEELSAEETKKSAAKDSGLFDDLKSSKTAASEPLTSELDVADDDLSLTDDDLLKEFSVEPPAADSDDDSLELTLDDDEPIDTPRITVDEALAALDSEELAKRPVTEVSDSELAAFQKENGYIDIDRLLNDADESEAESDPYQSLDVDVGDIDSLMGDTPMVDVDDEENSVNAKLDLARAYIEIDDNDSAKVLLQEVQRDGNGRQQEEAASLLKSIE